MSSEHNSSTLHVENKQQHSTHKMKKHKTKSKSKSKSQKNTEHNENNTNQIDEKSSTKESDHATQSSSQDEKRDKNEEITSSTHNEAKESEHKSSSSDQHSHSHSHSSKHKSSTNHYHSTLPPVISKPKSSKRFPIQEGTAVWSKISVKRSGNLKGFPKSRNSHTASVIGSNIWLFGGHDREHSFNDLHVFDSHKRRWHSPHMKGTPPTARFGHAAAVINDQIFIIGGREGEESHRFLNDVHILDIERKEWLKPKVHGLLPPPRNFHTVSVVGKSLFLFGGSNATHSFHDAYMFNTEERVWSEVSLEGIPILNRFIHTSFSVGNKIYVFSGNESLEYLFNEVHILDIEKMEWTGHTFARGSEPPRRSGHSGASITLNGRHYFVLFGGLGNHENLNDVEILDIEHLHWYKCVTSGRPPMPRHLHSVSVIGDAMFVFGGVGLKGRQLHDMPVLIFDGYRFEEKKPTETLNEASEPESSDKETLKKK